MSQRRPLVIGSAGHVDHGKTALVRALTGIDTDRLPDEKARGITTELGFAHLRVAGDLVAVIDVPGHERFVRAMVAGAWGVDLVMLVVAADEGVRPQTREHLAICQLLGVRGGVIVLSKCDLVDGDRLVAVEAEVRHAAAGTFLADAPCVAVSTITGAGLPALREQLEHQLAALTPRGSADAFRLPIDRVFTRRGFGTVVTGTVQSGRVAVGDELVVQPSQRRTRVRGLEVHGAGQGEAVAGQRCAINVADLAVDQLARGEVLCHPGVIEPSHLIDVQLRVVAAAERPMGRRERVLLHHGTTVRLAHLVLLDTAELHPGHQGLAQLRLDAEQPIAALPGDRFLLRGFAATADHGTTWGGGEVLRVLAAKARQRDGASALTFAAADGDGRLVLEVKASGHHGRDLASLARRTGEAPAALAARLGRLVELGELVAVGGEPRWHHPALVADLERRMVSAVTQRSHAAATASISRSELRAGLSPPPPPALFDGVLDGLVRTKQLALAGDLVARPGAAMRAADGDDALLDQFRGWGLEPPRPKDIIAAAGSAATTQAGLDRLLARGAVIKVKPDLWVEASAIAALRQRLLDYLASHGEIGPAAWKELTGTSRKYSIPLAEYFDGVRLTLRVGDLRRKR